MGWRKKKKLRGKSKYYSVSKLLQSRKKITPQFEVMLNSLALEEIIALKLELAAKASGSPLYGVPLWKSLVFIVREAVLKFAISATRSKAEAATFLGISREDLWRKEKYYQTESFFSEEEKSEQI